MFSEGRSKRFVARVAALALMTGAAWGGWAQTVDGGPDAIPDVGVEQKMGAQIDLSLEFRDELARKVRLGDYFKDGKPVILSLVYFECPMLCGEILNGMLRAFQQLDYTVGKEFTVLTVSFDPEESPSMASQKKLTFLKEYARENAELGWHFLTGAEASSKALADSVGFGYAYIPRLDQYAHGSAIMVLTPEGKVSQYFGGIEYPAHDLRDAIDGASQNKIGAALQSFVRMLCYRYDPITGQYTASVMKILRAAGVLTVGLLAASIALTVARDRAKKRAAKGGRGGHLTVTGRP